MLFVTGCLIASASSVALLTWGAIYCLNATLYSFWLKNHVIIDVIMIAIGFVLRLLAGCAAITVEPSSWLLVCGFSLSLFLGFGKRRSEVVNLAQREDIRAVLSAYSPAKLDLLIAICCAVTLL
jgi:4-hydroxybenzoate polyprenyltransferase